MRDEDSGQMMLLAAVVLLIAFMTLSVLVGRIGSISGETQRDAEGHFLREVRMVEQGLAIAPCSALVDFEARRGYSLVCPPTGDPVLTDGLSSATFS